MNLLKSIITSASFLLIAASASFAEELPKPQALPAGQNMYVIEREMPGLGKLSPDELRAASQTSCRVLKDLGPQITWLYSYITGNKMYCVYTAPNTELVRKHAKEGGFPANAVNQVTTIISPKTAE
jgi:hypothetical protein